MVVFSCYGEEDVGVVGRMVGAAAAAAADFWWKLK
jgi:hypothetical protein